MLGKEEMQVLDHLVMAWDKFNRLESIHPMDSTEFIRDIHAAQNIVMARPVVKDMQEAGIVPTIAELEECK